MRPTLLELGGGWTIKAIVDVHTIGRDRVLCTKHEAWNRKVVGAQRLLTIGREGLKS